MTTTLALRFAIKMISMPDDKENTYGSVNFKLSIRDINMALSPTMLYYNRQLRHPNSVTLMGACKQVNQLLNVMNYVAGCNLNQEIFQHSLAVSLQ